MASSAFASCRTRQRSRWADVSTFALTTVMIMPMIENDRNAPAGGKTKGNRARNGRSGERRRLGEDGRLQPGPQFPGRLEQDHPQTVAEAEHDKLEGLRGERGHAAVVLAQVVVPAREIELGQV